MSILQAWYPGDRALEFGLIIALGVMLLSGAAWIAARRLPTRPAARHLVLISALFGCLAMPVVAAAFSTLGFALISIPILPPGRTATNASGAAVRSIPTLAPGSRAGDPRSILIRGYGAPGDPTRSGDPEPRRDSPGTAATAAMPQPVSATAGPAPRWGPHPVGWSMPYRAIATLALIAWGCGTMLLLLRFARSWRLVERLRRASVPLGDATLLGLRDEAGRALGIRRLPRVFVTRRASTPLAFGFRRPVIILPDRLIGVVSDEEMRDVLLHELAHLSRRDPLAVIVQELARSLYWPIVSIHALIRELGRAREELCDNYVLQGRDALSYGETLLHLAELSRDATPLGAAVGVMQWRGELERRIAGLLDQGRSTMTRSNRRLVCLVALLFVAGGTVASATRLSAEGRPTRDDAPKVKRPQDAKSTAVASEKPPEKPGRSMRIHVLGPDGRPMAGVKVHRSVWTRKPIKDANRDYVTDGRGPIHVDLPEGIYILRLWARTKGHVPLFAHWEEEDNPETSLPPEFTFHLRPGTVIGGVVRDGEGRPIKGVIVEAELGRAGRAEGRVGPDMWLAYQDPRSQRVNVPVTDDQGRWTLDNVPPGDDLELRLKLSHPDYISDPNWGTMQEQQGVDLKALRARTAAITMRGGIVAMGTVTDSAGKPIAGAVVVRGDHPYWEVGSQEVRTDEQGRYRLPPLPSGKVTVTAMAPEWMPALTKADIRKEMGPVDFRLRPGRELRIRFVDQAGKPIPGVGVGIDKWRGGESLYNHRHPNVLDTKIPVQADESGLYRWTWAPDDAVTYRFYKEGYVNHQADLTANGSEQTITLPRILRIAGKVTDGAGRPIQGVTAIPVLEFRPGHLLAERNRAKGPFAGTYALEVDRTDVAYRVRIEAPGYRSAMSETARAGMSSPTFDFRLEPAPPIEGRLVDSGGRPIKDASVYLATSSQNLNDWPEGEERGAVPNSQKVLTDRQGRFAFPAQFERYAIVVVHDRGYAEVHLEPGQQPGELALKAWAQVEGRLVHAGQPVPAAWITCAPLRILNESLPHIQDGFSVKTDRDGRFVFPRVPPVKANVRAQLSVWGDYPFSSSQSVPLDLQPGQKARVDLGGEGTLVRGRVVLSGDAASKIDLHKSLNWLLRRAPGIEPPPEVRASGLSARNGWNNAWTSTREGLAFIETLHTYFVVLDPDGRFQISGVPAGDYDLALQLYEPPGDGCLVSPVGSRIVRFTLPEDAARGARFDLGEIPVRVALGPRVGDPAPDFTATMLSGQTVTLSRLRGRYVLLDFWATWCGPCVANLPALARFHDTFAASRQVTVLGLNLDDDPDEARSFLRSHNLSWTQAHLGGRAGGKDDVLSLYAISSIPTYILIGPDGKLIHRGDNLDEIARTLRQADLLGQ
jgi:beta-lactamase regulating signal transducer with metallopeptidase domain/thiol-disulfide isomerase/thioredoxin